MTLAYQAPQGVSNPDPILQLDAIALNQALHRREISCEALMRATLARIEELNPRFNAIVALRPQADLLAQARQADAELRAGQSRGFLHGMPQAIKDLAPAKGLPFTRGSPLFRTIVAEADGLVVERMRASGAIIIGKTNTPEFGFGSNTYNPVYGATHNAYAHGLTAGGSSGGAAVALALHILPVADGSDMGGSLRNPAAYNNVVGFRPSQGRVPMWPNLDTWFGQMGVEGPMARNVRDVAQLLAVQAGRDDRVPLSLQGDGSGFAQPLQALESSNARPLRIGWLGDWQGVLPYEPGVLELCESALKRWAGRDLDIVPLDLGFDPDRLWTAWVHLRSASVAATLGEFARHDAQRELLKPEALWEIEQGLALSAVQLHQASMVRTQWYAAYLRLFEQVDFVAAPSAQVWPWPVQTPWPKMVAGRAMDTYHRWMQGVSPWTLAGAPALNVPAGFSDQGMPMGVQLIGPPQADWSVLRLGQRWMEQVAQLV
jgi:amidase